MDISAERMTLGEFPQLIEKEHVERYTFAAELVRGKKVADVACGTGYGTQLLAKAGATQVCGFDISEEAVGFARERYGGPNIQFAAASAENLGLVGNEQFDVVVSFETIEHLQNVEAFLNEIRRILRPGGVFLVSTPDRRIGSVMYCFRGRPENQFHVHEYTRQELLTLIASKFQVDQLYGQAFVPRWLVFWPLQFTLKVCCRLLSRFFPKVRDFKDALYSDQGNVKVLPERPGSRAIAKFWLVACHRPSR